MNTPALSPEDFDRLAAEHVLGLLDGAEAVRAERMMAEDPGFRAAVEAWRARFEELDFTTPPLEAPDELLARINATLDATPPAGTVAAPVSPHRGADIETEKVRVAPRPAPKTSSFLGSLWHSLGFWRFAGFAGGAAAALLALLVLLGPLSRPPTPAYVAVLMSAEGQPAAVVNAFSDGTAELIPLRGIDVPEGRVLEVWTLWDPARGPVSIGLAGEARTIRLDLKNLPRTAPNQLFEITLEPEGGSPVGRPTGPVLMKGTTSVAL